VIDNINPFKNLVLLSKQLSDIRLQKDYLLQCEKNNAIIDELSKELKALVIVQKELKEDRERFIKKDNISINKIDEIDKNFWQYQDKQILIAPKLSFHNHCQELTSNLKHKNNPSENSTWKQFFWRF
jgi:hypothetical protein